VRSLLVANRGEIARRVFRTARAMGVGTVAVYSDADADAPFVAEAQASVHLPGNAPSDTYLRGDLVIAAALAAGADAVHPGYGFLSEDAAFARAVLDAGLIWVGPPPAAIDAMGSKIEAKALMSDAGVPVLPGGEVSAGTDLVALAEGIGYPVLVKASAGGGGRGMRVVEAADQLADAVASAQREAESAFGSGRVFLERYVQRPRHVEVQVVADAHGQVFALGERDCSLQRRHQKVVEEAPSPAVTPAVRERLLAAAVTAARAVDYRGVGTVEFVLSGEQFWFLEMNTRLQVEHPVTELVTGLDLVRLQLLVADGQALPASLADVTVTGHAVEARLYAEDAAAGFLPSTGTLSRFDVPGDIRVDSGVETGSVVGVHYDAMLAKVVAHGATREEATAKLAAALAGARVHGVTTNRDLLVRVLRSPEWRDGEVDTGHLERADLLALAAPTLPEQGRRLHAVAAALAAAAGRRAGATALAGLPTGWRNLRSQPQRASYDGLVVTYAHGRDGLTVTVDGTPLDGVRLWSASSSLVDLQVAGVRRRYEVSVVGGTTWVDSPLGSSAMVEDEPLPLPGSALAPGSLTAPMPGTVLRVSAGVGAQVAEGDVLLVLEAMKMEHAVRAPVAGTVTALEVQAGQQVDAGAVLAVVESAA
jgi:propionyl-CoA carboxylase alpha chain